MRQRVRATPLLLEGPSQWGECRTEEKYLFDLLYFSFTGPRTVSHDCRYGKSLSDTVIRPYSSNTTITNFSTFLEKKIESKRKNDQKIDFHIDKK